MQPNIFYIDTTNMGVDQTYKTPPYTRTQTHNIVCTTVLHNINNLTTLKFFFSDYLKQNNWITV